MRCATCGGSNVPPRMPLFTSDRIGGRPRPAGDGHKSEGSGRIEQRTRKQPVRVDVDPADPHGEMDGIRSMGSTGQTENRAATDALADLDRDRRQIRVAGLHPTTMVDRDRLITDYDARKRHRPVLTGGDCRAGNRVVVDAPVAGVPPDRLESLNDRTGNRRVHAFTVCRGRNEEVDCQQYGGGEIQRTPLPARRPPPSLYDHLKRG